MRHDLETNLGWRVLIILLFMQNLKNKLILICIGIFFMEFLVDLWNNQPNTVVGVVVATSVLLGIYIFLLNTYK